MNKDTEQLSFLEKDTQTNNEPVVCLGLTFNSEEERREYFRNELRKKLPELKEIEGFPIGEDEDIIALSDPPYYTACPNPWINEFIEEWEKAKVDKYGRDPDEGYFREPFVADVSEGKNDPIYTAHTYHTKVPYKAIMKFILHYTKPGDIVLDGFAGTGMTGVASSLCNNKDIITSLGYKVKEEKVYDTEDKFITELGNRQTIINDLSPAATFIASNYCSPVDVRALKVILNQVLEETESKWGWLYETNHNSEKGVINYVIWSDVFSCPHCSIELIFYDVAVNESGNKVKDEFLCTKCNAKLKKNDLNRVKTNTFDTTLYQTIEQSKQVPVAIHYKFNKKRYIKRLDQDDKDLLNQIENIDINKWYPVEALPGGTNTKQPLVSHGFSHVHHFYTKRNLIILSEIYNKIETMDFYKNKSKLIVQSVIGTLVSKLVRYNLGNRGNGPLNGTLYVSSLNAETNVFNVLKGKLNDFVKALIVNDKNVITSSQSTNLLKVKENSIDYIFTDPPFGSNINYSELNSIWEAWLKVRTNQKLEAIVNSTQRKGINEYQEILKECFKLYYKVLKPGRWMTVEFSNSKASIWNAIQEAIQKNGFVIANVSALDKKQGSFKAVTTTTAVKQDLVISAYKPKDEAVTAIKNSQNTEGSAWAFVSQHLQQLTVFMGIKGEASVISERTPRILFDRMIAYHVQNGYSVPISSGDFQSEVAQRFPMRDGMVFLESQVAEYDKKRILVKEFSQLNLFVSDEGSAIEWLRQLLMKKPQTRQDVHPNFMMEIQHIAKHEQLPELDYLLLQNFLKYEGDTAVPDQIASYLRRNYKEFRGLENGDEQLKQKALNRWYVPDPNKQADLEKLREKSLLREFGSYLEELSKNKKKLKQFRTEAVRAGFKKAWGEKNYEKIVEVGGRLPESVIQEDDKLLMYYDNAQIRLGL